LSLPDRPLPTCTVCGEKTDPTLVMEEFYEIFQQADGRGVESLTEQQQVVYEWHCCSMKCFEKLE
jgi:hypothetical protein